MGNNLGTATKIQGQCEPKGLAAMINLNIAKDNAWDIDPSEIEFWKLKDITVPATIQKTPLCWAHITKLNGYDIIIS